jgi:3-deoxy-D-manno-octulosonate 8-phosphate phosphatase (KDO 8-P phosphatase)
MGLRAYSNLKTLILDVDGVLTTGQMGYTRDGKLFKVFGPHDRDGLKILGWSLPNIKFITADKTGFQISYARIVTDWGYRPDQLILVPEATRMKWFEDNVDFSETVYIADGYFDADILRKVAFGIAPANARIEAREAAKYITPSRSAEGAVMDACLYIQKGIDSEAI